MDENSSSEVLKENQETENVESSEQVAAELPPHRAPIWIWILVGVLGLVTVMGLLFLGYSYVNQDTEESVLEQVQSNEIDISTLPHDEDMRDWQTYRNEELGFEFKYPAGSRIIENEKDVVSFENEDKDVASVLFFNVKDFDSLEEFISIKQQEYYAFCEDDQLSGCGSYGVNFYFTLNGFRAANMFPVGPESINIIVETPKVMLVFTSAFSNSSLVEQIYPTLTLLTSPLGSSAWQTYRNEEFGFGFNYPASWKEISLTEARNHPNVTDIEFALRKDGTSCFLVFGLIDTSGTTQAAYTYQLQSQENYLQVNRRYIPGVEKQFIYSDYPPYRSAEFGYVRYKGSPVSNYAEGFLFFEADPNIPLSQSCVGDIEVMLESLTTVYPTAEVKFKDLDGELYFVSRRIYLDESGMNDFWENEIIYKHSGESRLQLYDSLQEQDYIQKVVLLDKTLYFIVQDEGIFTYSLITKRSGLEFKAQEGNSISDFAIHDDTFFVLTSDDPYCFDNPDCSTFLYEKNSTSEYNLISTSTPGRIIVGFLENNVFTVDGYGDAGCYGGTYYKTDLENSSVTADDSFGFCFDPVSDEDPPEAKRRNAYLEQFSQQIIVSETLSISAGEISVSSDYINSNSLSPVGDTLRVYIPQVQNDVNILN